MDLPHLTVLVPHPLLPLLAPILRTSLSVVDARGNLPSTAIINDVAIFPTNRLEDIYLPSYRRATTRTRPSLLHIDCFDDLRTSVTHARRLLFAAARPRFFKPSRLRLHGAAQELDSLLAGYLLSRDLSAEFGTAVLEPTQLVGMVRRDSEIVSAAAEVKARVTDLEERFREVVVEPLEGVLGRRKQVDHKQLLVFAKEALVQSGEEHRKLDVLVDEVAEKIVLLLKT